MNDIITQASQDMNELDTENMDVDMHGQWKSQTKLSQRWAHQEELDAWWGLNFETPHRRASPSTYTCTLPATTHNNHHTRNKPIHNNLYLPAPATNPQTIPLNHVQQYQCNCHRISSSPCQHPTTVHWAPTINPWPNGDVT
jgi:hypothetical protein